MAAPRMAAPRMAAPRMAAPPSMASGDARSVTLGFLLTASLVFFSQGANALIKPVTVLWLVSLPLMDMHRDDAAPLQARSQSGRSKPLPLL